MMTTQTTRPSAKGRTPAGCRSRLASFGGVLGRFPLAIHQLQFRLAIAGVFLTAGLTKVADWETAAALFRDEYKVPVLPPEVAATLSGLEPGAVESRGREDSSDMRSSSSAITLTPVRARRAVSAVFFLNGVALATWVAHIPAVKAQHGLGDDRLGFVLLAMAVGAVSTLPLAAWLIARWGSRCVTCVASVGFCVTLPLPIVAPGAWLVAAALAVFGAMNALLDVSMNRQAVMVEDRYHRPIMPTFHALFSAGGVVGALVASASMAGGLGSAAHAGLVTAVSLAVLALALRRLLPSSEHGAPPGPVFARPRANLLSLALLTFCGLLVEGAMSDWSAVYLRDSLRTTASVAAGGFAAFSLTMAAGRFAGSFLADWLGGPRLLRCSGAVAATGLGLGLLAATPWSALIGFGLVGLGLANVIPVVFSATGRVPGVPAGTALAAVATTGYAAYLAGPPIIGLAAGVVGLPSALAIVVACCGLIAVQANALPTFCTEVKEHAVADTL